MWNNAGCDMRLTYFTHQKHMYYVSRMYTHKLLSGVITGMSHYLESRWMISVSRWCTLAAVEEWIFGVPG